ncbi:hypothetical protein EDD69_1231 [Thermolongibacillus altinsuensis]|jgi:predicted nucleotidyltransferase|uniref:Polymerase beta nucleotidyltransferase domain-containing protein n=1 Tax=Thermolongibacillus altinsuensis TaxID=575256 RepID=A0A4R1QCP7_9BACL|nr:nucleotidyltransferase domain-containing protein [Thermolongibacillus altinsuensis]TCL44776.1 hypothetical protein EDD69_1231 [Thermolongibacillus altinsuensis]GMB09190.1 hypothetical protein B1no1_19000 [Thermolongibacillus altinsuensis]
MISDWNSTGISKRWIGELQTYCSTNDKIEKVVLFGSRARGDYQKTSDIDLVIWTKNASHSEQNLMEHAIQQMPTPFKIDVLFFDRLTKEKLISNILKEGIVIYEKGAALRKA